MRIPIVRHGDETTTRGKVIALTATIHDDGRKIALYGDQATCGNCKGLWNIVGTGEGMGEKGRVAVINGDHVLCPCGKNRVIASPTAGMFIHLDKGAASTTARGTSNGSDELLNYDEQFTLRDAKGRALANTFYTVRFPTGELVHGVTDATGSTGRYATDGAYRIAVYLGHGEA
ncbi:PAAR motif-containing protein [Paraburkholderia sacchari]|uniref:PAAR domain-containing protein n=1 Tax=Paraburkholderia sacchari TaxID=159450 RepID=UPI0039A54F82